MPPDLHLDPERLHTHGSRLSAIVDALVPMPTLDACTRTAVESSPRHQAILAELDRTTEVLDRACRELGALATTLHDIADAASSADAEAARSIARVIGRLA